MKFHQILVDSGMLTTGEKLDKDRFRRDLGNVKEAYVEILKRIS